LFNWHPPKIIFSSKRHLAQKKKIHYAKGKLMAVYEFRHHLSKMLIAEIIHPATNGMLLLEY
jgi:hypothetical protein